MKSGRYLSASEVVREALRLLEERDRVRAVRLDELRKEIRKGRDSGDPIDGDVVLRQLRANNRTRSRRGA